MIKEIEEILHAKAKQYNDEYCYDLSITREDIVDDKSGFLTVSSKQGGPGFTFQVAKDGIQIQLEECMEIFDLPLPDAIESGFFESEVLFAIFCCQISYQTNRCLGFEHKTTIFTDSFGKEVFKIEARGRWHFPSRNKEFEPLLTRR